MRERRKTWQPTHTSTHTHTHQQKWIKRGQLQIGFCTYAAHGIPYTYVWCVYVIVRASFDGECLCMYYTQSVRCAHMWAPIASMSGNGNNIHRTSPFTVEYIIRCDMCQVFLFSGRWWWWFREDGRSYTYVAHHFNIKNMWPSAHSSHS